MEILAVTPKNVLDTLLAGALPEQPPDLFRQRWEANGCVFQHGSQVVLTHACHIWDDLREWSRDELIGLHTAERVELTPFAPLLRLVRSAPDVRNALEAAINIASSFDNSARFSLRVEGGIGTFSILPLVVTESHTRSEFAAALFLRFARLFVPDVVFESVELSGALPASAEEAYAAYFQCPVVSAGPATRCHFSADYLNRRLDSRAPESFEEFLRTAHTFRAPTPEHPVARLERLYDDAMADGDDRIEVVAERLGISVRSLRRRLTATGVSHVTLRDQARRRRAVALLRAGEASLQEIATAVGFSDTVAFGRAFQRWLGTSPGAFRQAYKDVARQHGQNAAAS